MRKTIYIFLLFAATLIQAQLMDEVYLETFKTQSFGKDGQLAWNVFGKQAEIVSGDVLMKEALITFFSKSGEVKIKALKSVFDKDNSLWSSDKTVKVRGTNLSLDGVGFTMDLKRKRIHIKSKVSVVFKRSEKIGVKREK